MNDSYLPVIEDSNIKMSDKASYNDMFRDLYLPLVAGYRKANKRLPKQAQKALFYRIFRRIRSNLNEKNKELLSPEDIDELLIQIKEILSDIDDQIILNFQTKGCHPSYLVRNFLLSLKYENSSDKIYRRYFLKDNLLWFSHNNIAYCFGRKNRLKITCLNVKDGDLVIDAEFADSCLLKLHPDAIIIKCGEKEYKYAETNIYALTKVFGRTVGKSYTFQVNVPINDLKVSGLSFCLRLEGAEIELPLSFPRSPSRLYEKVPHSYWIVDKHNALVCNRSGRNLKIVHLDDFKFKLREILFRTEISSYLVASAIKHKRIPKEVTELIKIRDKYLKSKGSKNEEIWVYFDKLFKAGDNGEYAFRYAYYNDKTIKPYYLINQDCPDYHRLKEEFGDSIVTFGTFECKLLGLLADVIIATHPDIIEFFGYTYRTSRAVRDLFNAKLVCIAHGVTIQRNAEYQNRVFDNTMFYTTSSKYELMHIMHPVYGYTEDQVALTGMARFDGLVSNDKHQILIAPTWRRSISGTGARNASKSYNSSFKDSSYYKIYNSLINDARVLTSAKSKGYRILFLVHPLMSAQVNDYEKNDLVDIIPMSGDTSYEKVLTESSLMITDYSGIHYDFGYMRKPVIYYQPKEVPMRFEEGGMKFATMGFGPLCYEYEEVVNYICSFMENDCLMPEEYKKRADDFFAFDDYNNSERIHRAVKEWLSR